MVWAPLIKTHSHESKQITKHCLFKNKPVYLFRKHPVYFWTTKMYWNAGQFITGYQEVNVSNQMQW